MCCVNRTRTLFWLFSFVLIPAGAAHGQTTYYVDDDGASATCTGWGDACPDLQTALGLAVSGDQIWVAAGTYIPTSGADRTATFQMITGVALYGGFDGTETLLEERAGLFEQTILSGDIGTADDYSDNSYHVVTGSGTDATAVLDGFTIAGGNANATEPNDRGGGMYNELGSPTLLNCVFTHNRARGSVMDNDARGGGMYNASSSPTLTDCAFRRNRADGGPYSSGLGGGIYNRDSHPTLTNCTFQENQADGGWEGGLGAGGGMFNYNNSQPMLINCTFTGNRGGSSGGGLCSSESSPTLIGCLFNWNATTAWAARDYGGGMYHGGIGTPVLANCTFFDNHADYGGGLYSGCDAQTTVTNCIFWHNADRDGMLESSQISVELLDMNYTCVEGLTGGLGGTGNIGDDPLFADPDGADDIPRTDDDDLRLTSCSPAIDAADHTAVLADILDLDGDGDTDEPIPFDLDGNPRFADDSGTPDTGSGVPPIVDMGAYEFQGTTTECCGNGIIEGSEACDDGNTDDGDCCSLSCTVEPGCACIDEPSLCSTDCNDNDLPDACDINCGALGGACDVPGCGLSSDDNENGIPDECECPPTDPPTQPAGEAGYEKVRYISMVPGNPGRLTALRVHLKTLPPPFAGLNSTKCWVGEPQQVSENSGKIAHEPGWPDFMSANLQGSPLCMDWSTVGTLHVTDDDIVPAAQPPGGVFIPAIYDVQAIDCDCDFSNEANYSAPLTITTSKWGDLVGHCAVIPCTPPDGVVNITTDVTACVDKFRNLEGAVLKSRADIEPNLPDWLVNIADVTFVLDAFRGFAYPAAQTPPAPGWPGPDGCP